LLAHGFIRAGLPTAQAERIVARGQTMEARVKITEAGRRALAAGRKA
jgi:hypothetical protein